ncbi:MAG: CusA/CzcA family heavy metal efflux RND transporter [Gallionellaceae bacterium]|nr:CusA/CzcA family heavy metal efflux RND transporter [Gallionellaceae bacterium]
MIRRLVSLALNQPMFVVLGLLLFIGAGIAAFKGLPVEAFPDVSDTQVTVITLYSGRAAEEVEKQVTIPLEVALSGLPHSVRVFSHTQFGLSYLTLTFDDQADAYFARQQVNERLRDAALPDGVEPMMAPLSTSIGEIYRFQLRGKGMSSQGLRTLQDWVVERQLRQVPGVADLVTMGGSIKTWEVRPNPAKLRDHGIGLQDLVTALQRGNANAGGGYVAQGSQQYLIRGIGLLTGAKDIENVVVSARDGVPVLVRDVATVGLGNIPRQGIVGRDDDDDVVTGIVVMRKGENPSEVLKGIKDKVAQLNHGILPPGVSIEPFYDRAWLIDKTLHTVFGNLVEGAALVSLVLFLFLGNLRAALIVALVIPLSLLGTFLGLTFKGIPANLLSLGAMDFGIIVDGAVIVMENIFRRLSEASEHSGKSRLKIIQEAATEVGRPTFFSMLIIIAAHLPIFTLQRHEGRIFSPMAWSVVSALVVALILSLTLVPLLARYFLPKHLPHEHNRLVEAFARVYRPTLAWALGHKRSVLGIALAALAASLALVPRLGTEFLPELDEGSIWVNVTMPNSVSIPEAVALTRQIRAALHRVPEVESVVSKAGRPEDGTDPKAINMAEVLVDLKEADTWRPGMKKEDLLRQMEAEVEKLPGVDASFSQPIRDNVLENISQIDGQIVIKVFGTDTETLRQTSQNILGAIAHVRGVNRAFIDRAGTLPQWRIEVDRDKAARYGLRVADIQDMIETSLGGKEATQIWEGERRFVVMVRLAEPDRVLARMHDILISTPSGAHVPLDEVAHFSAASGAMNIARENGGRVMAIGVFIRDRDMGSVVADMQQAVQTKVKLPREYRITWSGEFENQERAMARLAVIVPISVLLIFVLLFDAFKSFKNAALILLNIPFAMIGGILALFLTGIPLSVSAAIGFIALFGQAVLNGVVMITTFNQLRGEGQSWPDAVTNGAMLRMRTVLMTGLLAMLGLLPMALSHAIGAETQRPLAVVVIGGLISATLLTLVVLPTLYAWAHQWGAEKRD